MIQQVPRTSPGSSDRSRELFEATYGKVLDFTADVFRALLLFQWATAGVLAAAVSPLAWFGEASGPHAHLVLATVLGGLLTLPPFYLLTVYPRHVVSRVVVTICQMLWTALLIHLTGGRIETHFHIFGSLALIAFYRDSRLLAPATLVATLDHALRGLYWPESVYGVSNPEWWRFLEHAGWVGFLDLFLVVHCRFAYEELQGLCQSQAKAEWAFEAARSSFELEVERDAAEAAARQKASFLASMSHEIRTPMNAVIGMTNLLADSDLDENQRELVRTVETSGEHLMMLINDVLDLSKIEAEKVRLEEAPFSLREGLEDCFDLIGRERISLDVDLTLEVAEHLPKSFVGDVGRLRQIVVNLVSNAVKFTEVGEVAVVVDGEELGEGVWSLELLICDSGLGIAPERLPYLFEPFTQADATTTRTHGGTGLGLSICRGLARAMGGEITASSEPGKGSTFAVTLQVRTNGAGESDGEIPPRFPGRRVLIVDDNPQNLRILRAYLEGLDLDVTSAATPREAMEAMDAGDRFELAMLDFQMPEMDGVELGRELARLDASMPRILLTSDPARAVARGASGVFDRVLAKPVRRTRITEAVADQLTHRVVPAPPLREEAVESYGSLRVLLAEDNKTNQRVATLHLKKLGLPPENLEIVDDGHAAVIAVARGSYQLVLMDVQMPGMDGLEATQVIRSGFEVDGAPGPRPWIVALTADVVGEARERCLAAGMDGFLEKPLQRDGLKEALDRAAAGPPETLVGGDCPEPRVTLLPTRLSGLTDRVAGGSR